MTAMAYFKLAFNTLVSALVWIAENARASQSRSCLVRVESGETTKKKAGRALRVSLCGKGHNCPIAPIPGASVFHKL